MADHFAAHDLVLPAALADLSPIFLTKGISDVQFDHLHNLASSQPDVDVGRAVVTKALTYLARSTIEDYIRIAPARITQRFTFLTATALVLVLTVIGAAHEFLVHSGSPWMEILKNPICGVLVMMILAVGCGCGKGGPAWSVVRLLRLPWEGVIHTPDGPRGWPIVGSWKVMQGVTMHRDLAKLAWNGGTATRRLMALSVGATRVVISSDAKVAKQILQSAVFGDRPLKQAAHELGFARAIGFAVQGPYWRHLRKLAVTHMFSHKQIVATHDALQGETSRMIVAIADDMMAHDARPEGSGLCIQRYLLRAAVNNLTTTVLGRHFGFGAASCGQAHALEGLIREGFELLGAFNCADHVPLLHLVPFLPFASRCRSLRRRVRAFLQPIVQERRRHLGRQGDCSAFVDVLLSLEGDQKLADDDMIAVLWEMVFRGTDTIAVLTEWALAEVILNPEIQKRIHEELDEAVGRHRLVQPKDIDRLPYLQAVVKETLRVHPPGPLLSWARLAVADTEIAGYHIPSGTTAMVNMWAITHDPTLWPHPSVFDPSRFLTSHGGVELDVLGTDLRLAPFGSGRRVCPGRSQGLATAHLWLARLLHHYSWSPDASHPILLTENLKLSCEMASPLQACAVARIPSCGALDQTGSDW